MTVRELRSLLFNVTNQEAEVVCCPVQGGYYQILNVATEEDQPDKVFIIEQYKD